MKPTKELIKKVDKINGAFQVEEEAFHIPNGGAAFFVGENGSVDPGEDFDYFALNVETWPELGKTMTDKGRAELNHERAAVDRIFATIKGLGFEVERTGDGYGQNGPVTCYELKLRRC